jgi:biopolymer transport protein ExbD
MHRKKPEADSKITLPITAMLDMTFQLLFFFIINFRPADLEGQMDMSLPSEAEKQAHDQKKADPSKAVAKDPQPEFQSDLTVSVSTQGGLESQGSIVSISVRGLEGKDEAVNGLDGLRRYLEEKKGSVKTKDAIKVYGDGRLRVKWVMQVMDVCRRAGFEKISFVPPREAGK